MESKGENRFQKLVNQIVNFINYDSEFDRKLGKITIFPHAVEHRSKGRSAHRHTFDLHSSAQFSPSLFQSLTKRKIY